MGELLVTPLSSIAGPSDAALGEGPSDFIRKIVRAIGTLTKRSVRFVGDGIARLYRLAADLGGADVAYHNRAWGRLDERYAQSLFHIR